MKLYYDSATEAAPVVIDGEPPVDQSALVAQLQAQIASLTAFKDMAVADANARKAADAANVDGQNLIDAAAGLTP
jgi:hypothetical protein